MTRNEVQLHNKKVIKRVRELIKIKLNAPYRIKIGYKELAYRLNAMGIYSSRGNRWTFRSMFRMMQRQGVRLFDIR